ncbi:MAG TPA: PEP-CTERM sorting domain-containing protein [Anaerohalosphaeraceae bacterium]|nr:PEP-CTERM sorting domain-containing protein [Anaerohalosphaeraceae bacterium]HQG05491.1 PEP-CTERM sorting domain-containing protein [Anaerohalosphaeraceae bacterium]HQI06864.1 PEP-CTERM sorting domain-containing protein [Anaerohalosphaeraceae bacterium]HQJ68550.1 PEP-CTERM sorting domain-containing protein [Anaerohalosphaeraceae bacterium]
MKRIVVLCLAAGLIGLSQAALIDDFQSYQAGLIRDGVTGGVWKEITAGSAFAKIGEEDGNRFLQTGWKEGGRGAYRSIPAIANTCSAATLFMQIYAITSSQDTSIGLADVVTTSAATWGDYEVQIALGNGDDAEHINLRARDGGTVETYMALELGQWYNIWAVIDQTNDWFDLYVTTGKDSARGKSPINPDPINFRNGTTADLAYFLALTNNRDMNYRLDNIYLTEGVDLINPTPEPCSLVLLGIGGLAAGMRKR